MTSKDQRYYESQYKFERNFIRIPFIIFAMIVLLLNIFYADINIMLVLFGLFFLYNGGLLFVSFIKHFKRTTILSLILFILSVAVFAALMYLYADANHLLDKK
ncbi:hypothetical protein N9R04_03495 [Staphylococcus sp. SQ8-PEA]|uniref:Uncharacterized protein n=1 Tax=Staphylococcus marylandisciuri TaxID=2981529 RepID=A0ABT2QP81_9STAP|nr:hypothetical protein [Staphylococcus marylandisciuri]MCU5745786.1 hypothetical protein [Staphylococcus marylandisciuri]